LYKPGKENIVADTLSRIKISTLMALPNTEIQQEIIQGYKDDPLGNLITAVEEREEPTNRFKIKDQMLYSRTDKLSHWRLCLPDTRYRSTVIYDNHDLAIAGHGRFMKTFLKIARSYYWLRMAIAIKKHIQECDACQRTKASTKPLAGLLHPLPIPEQPWNSIGMDFLGPLPKSKTGNDMILIVAHKDGAFYPENDYLHQCNDS
jgi:Integrase zinc binding domain